jgi:hypothetical protein
MFRPLVPEHDRGGKRALPDVGRGAVQGLADDLGHPGLATHKRLVHGPLEAVATHTLVAIEPSELRQLAQRHRITICLDVLKVLSPELIEHGAHDRPTHRVQCAPVLVGRIALNQECYLRCCFGHVR